MSDYLENKIIDHLFRQVSFTAPTALFVGLYTATPSDTGGGTEVSTTNTGYGRAALAPSTTNWAATNGATTTSATSSGTSGTTSNNVAVTYGTPVSTNWGTVSFFGIFDATTAGNLLWWGALTAPKTINVGDAAPSFAISSLSLQVDN